MTPLKRFHLPFINLAIGLAMISIGWAVFRLAKMEAQIVRAGQQSQEVRAIFRECQELFRESMANPELTRAESESLRQEGSAVTREYHSIADRLEADLPQLTNALTDANLLKMPDDMWRKLKELQTWVEKEKDRVSFERLDVRSKELKERLASVQVPTNVSATATQDLGGFLAAIDRSYETYLSAVTNLSRNIGKPFVSDRIARQRDRATQALGRLSNFKDRAQREARNIDSFLKSESRWDTAERLRRREQVIRAFLGSESPTEFARRVQAELPTEIPPVSTPVGSAGPSLRYVRYGLLVALVGLGTFLVLHLYWRGVVMPLRLKLVEREATIEQQKKVADLQQVVAGLAHEIRNPLTIVNARLYTVQRKLQEGTREHKDAIIIGQEIDRVNQILKDFIDLARPAPARLALMRTEPLLRDVCDLMTPTLQAQAIHLDCDPQSQAQFHGDQQQLKQVLINLVRNAADSIEREGIITLRSRDATVPFKGADSNVVIIEVEDDGPGIPPAVQAKVFEPFFSTKTAGTGLGLSLSAQIIHRHGGTLNLESEVGRGTTLRITLPAYEEK